MSEDCVLVDTTPIYHSGLTTPCDVQTHTCDAMNIVVLGRSHPRDFPFQLQHLFRHGMIIHCEMCPALAIPLCGDIV